MFSKFKKYIKVSKLDSIARRYFVMNAFDGALTMLGILVGVYMAGTKNVDLIIHAGIGASIALGMSGVTSAYMTEKAERKKALKELEDAMLTDLDDTVYGRANRFASLLTAIINGLSPTLAAFIILSPMLLVNQGLLDFDQAFKSCMAVTIVVLFGLGGYVGRISGESVLKSGVQMVVVGGVTAIVILIIEAS